MKIYERDNCINNSIESTVEINEIVKTILNTVPAIEVYLLGSFAYGNERDDSDTLVDSKKIDLAGLTENEKMPLFELCCSVTDCTIVNRNALDLFITCIDPYFSNSESYEKCISELKKRLDILISE